MCFALSGATRGGLRRVHALHRRGGSRRAAARDLERRPPQGDNRLVPPAWPRTALRLHPAVQGPELLAADADRRDRPLRSDRVLCQHRRVPPACRVATAPGPRLLGSAVGRGRLKPETRPAKRFVDALLAVVGVAILVRTGVWVADRQCRPTGRRGAVDGAASQASSELVDSCKGRMAWISDAVPIQ